MLDFEICVYFCFYEQVYIHYELYLALFIQNLPDYQCSYFANYCLRFCNDRPLKSAVCLQRAKSYERYLWAILRLFFRNAMTAKPATSKWGWHNVAVALTAKDFPVTRG